AAAIGSVDTSTAVASRKDISDAPTSPRVDDSAAVADDVVQWPVPAVDSGSPSTTVTVAAGRYTVAQRARAAAVLTPRLDAAGQQLMLEDRSVVTVDGRVVSTRPPL